MISFNFGLNVPSDCPNIHGSVIEESRHIGSPISSCILWGGYTEYATTSLINVSNPSEGILLSYGMGDSCFSKTFMQRQINFYFYCAKEQDMKVNIELFSLLKRLD
jgi:hypothetical protein